MRRRGRSIYTRRNEARHSIDLRTVKGGGMIIYTFQTKSVLDEAINKGIALVDFAKTNLYRNMERGADMSHAYLWMAKELSKKTGIWLHNVYRTQGKLYREKFGDLAFEDNSMPLFPFWGWYLVDGKNQRPGQEYNLANWGNINMREGADDKDRVLIELDIPDQFVLLSDANAWYCVLEGKPCYEYESEEDERRLLKRFYDNAQQISNRAEDDEYTVNAMYVLYREAENTWKNIFRLEGRRLRPVFPFGMEKRNVQAVFPYIDKKWIKNTWEY